MKKFGTDLHTDIYTLSKNVDTYDLLLPCIDSSNS